MRLDVNAEFGRIMPSLEFRATARGEMVYSPESVNNVNIVDYQ
jgi:hypothetical protein